MLNRSSNSEKGPKSSNKNRLVFRLLTNTLHPSGGQRVRCDQQLRIPMRSDARSLNLSNAVAVACYEALRQWQT
jgi:tRNA (cytidine/uridine-2'-O-)-methyltransferase